MITVHSSGNCNPGTKGKFLQGNPSQILNYALTKVSLPDQALILLCVWNNNSCGLLKGLYCCRGSGELQVGGVF
jgi:hypothetical protein